MKSSDQTFRQSLRKSLIFGCVIVLFLGIVVGGWAANTEIAGAVVAPGSVVVDTAVKKVQHPTGGVIGELLVRDGDHVREGDVLVRLDGVQARANLAMVSRNLDELRVRRARLEAERDNLDEIVFPDIVSRPLDANLARIISGEKRFFAIRRAAREGQKDQLRQRIAQLMEEIAGTEIQVSAKTRETEILERELEGVRDLWGKKLIQISRVTALERDVARLEGERGAMLSRLAEAKLKITETNLQIFQIDQDLRSEVARDLADIRGRMAEFEEREAVATDLLRRIDIVAPQTGTVDRMSVHTVGGVINAGEVLMVIVPNNDRLLVEAKIAPADIDQVVARQEAAVRFLAFNQRTTPELVGMVQRVSADIVEDEKSRTTSYLARVELDGEQIRKLEGLKMLPGMPVEVFIRTTSRTVISYLMRPLRDQMFKAFKDK